MMVVVTVYFVACFVRMFGIVIYYGLIQVFYYFFCFKADSAARSSK